MKVIFHKLNNERYFGKLIGWWTSPFTWKFNGKWKDTFSHTELLFSDGKMFSASQYSNSTRYTKHRFNEENWAYKHVVITSEQEEIIRKWCDSQVGKEYDYAGAAGFVIPFRQARGKWFCSEVVTAALHKVDMLRSFKPSKMSPNDVAFALGVI